MVTAVDRPRREMFAYTLRAERTSPVKEQTTFLLRPLTSLEFAACEDALCVEKDGVTSVRPARRDLIVLTLGLVGWDNFHDAEGRPVLYDATNRVANLDRLTPGDLLELRDAILRGTDGR